MLHLVDNLGMGEHTGTHFDAPVHWVTGKDYSDGACDTINVQRFVAPAVVIDVSKEAAADEKFLRDVRTEVTTTGDGASTTRVLVRAAALQASRRPRA